MLTTNMQKRQQQYGAPIATKNAIYQRYRQERCARNFSLQSTRHSLQLQDARSY